MSTRNISALLLAPAIALGLTGSLHAQSGDASQNNVPPEGFTALFNGKDLSGWFGHGTEDPRKLWAMSEAELAAHQQETLKDVHQHWSVEQGELVNDGHGLFLTTIENYGDFELLVDYKTVALADSGIYLRGVPQVQIWDPTEEAKFNIGADKGSGGLWNNSAGAPGKDPLHRMDKPFGDWNSFRIVMIGEHVSVWLNGKKVVDHARMENYFDRNTPASDRLPIFKEGPIQLQTHGGEIRWRNVFIRELGADESNRVLQARDDAGYVSLFNGVDLEGWQGAVDNYTTHHGTIMCKPGKGGTLFAEDEYSDFVFRFEFKLPPGGNNGVAVRAPLEGDPAWKAFEIQLLDDSAEKYAKLKDYQYHGSVYGSVPAKRGFLRRVGEWNFQEIRFKGSHITVSVNGFAIVDKDLNEVDQSKLGKRPDGFDRTSGFIGFAGHSDPVQMRNVRIKKLK